MAESFRLSASPNPFNPATAVGYRLPAPGHVSLRVYDTAGREVKTLVDGWKEAGSHEAIFDGSGLASGVYLVRMEAGAFTATRKMVLLK
ncbi:MAG: T9SS C-terminal target domain-containing protein [Candidatus Zixiibacteriota bacterium]|nr:MAG: T9SS C-terminal target domain-containing protein [candidate division Zixibacteria bacterium]